MLTTYTYDAANQLLTSEDDSGVTTYTYDAEGNRTRKETPTAITDYTWDEDNRMILAEPVAGDVSFTYNADGQRVRKETTTDTTKFIYDFKKLLQETDGSDTAEHSYTGTLQEYGDLVSEHDESAGTSSYHQYDALGSTDALVDENESITDTYQYRAFGLATHASGSSESPHTFVGRQNYYHDPEIELYYLGMGGGRAERGATEGRPVDPKTGAFIQKDRISPSDLNAYGFVGSNPVNHSDPSGLQEADDSSKDFDRKSLDDLLQRVREANRRLKEKEDQVLRRLDEIDEILRKDAELLRKAKRSMEQHLKPRTDAVARRLERGYAAEIRALNGMIEVHKASSRLAETIVRDLSALGLKIDRVDKELATYEEALREFGEVLDSKIRIMEKTLWCGDKFTSFMPWLSDTRDVGEVVVGRNLIYGKELDLVDRGITVVAVFLPVIGAPVLRRSWHWVKGLFRTSADEVVQKGLEKTAQKTGEISRDLSHAASKAPGELVTGKVVLGHFPEYVTLSEKIGARRFSVPTEVWRRMSEAEQWLANKKFLDRIIKRGDDVILATPFDQIRPRSALGKEVAYLLGNGYKKSEDGLRLLRIR